MVVSGPCVECGKEVYVEDYEMEDGVFIHYSCSEKEKKVFYVVYEAWKNGKSIGKGSCEATRSNDITSIDNIKGMEKEIHQDLNFDQEISILILSWTFLRMEVISNA